MQIEHPSDQPIRLVQITDSHLGDQPGEQLLGLDTDYSLGHVLSLLRQDKLRPDLLLATGDISNSGTVSSYLRFQQLTADIAPHALWLPGNHDQLAAMQQAVANGGQLSRSVTIGSWQVIMLNSTISGAVGGNISERELALLRTELEKSKGRHVLVCLHHHPVAIGCAWLDRQQVNNAGELFQLLDKYDHVRALLWGHIHQSINRLRNGVRLLATPSTCVQFAANSNDFKLARLNPGYRWLELHTNGDFETDVVRVSGVDFDVDYQHSSGY